MPEEASALLRIHEEALSKLNAWFSKAQRLSSVELESLYRRHDFDAGWRIPAKFGSETKRLDVLTTVRFPFTLPRIALVDPPAFLTWPHVERDGLLCLVSDTSTANHRAFITQVTDLLGDAHNLIAASIAGTNQADFRHEFHSYWSNEAGAEHIPFLSLISPQRPSRKISAWRGKFRCILAESDEALLGWMENAYTTEKQHEFDPAALIWLPEPLLPREYPKTAREVFSLARERAPDGLEILQDLAARDPKRVIVMLAAPGEHGPCLGGVTVPAPELYSNGKRVPPIHKGFRPGHMPESLLANRYWNSGTGITRAAVSRADSAWIHGRGKDSRHEQLSTATVVVVGSGSLGGPVGVQLAMAGVGKLFVIDPDKMRHSNVGRHPLGAKHVDEHKAEALVLELRKNYPHSQFEFRNKSWQNVLATEPGVFEGASLVISMTGDWGAEDALNTWHLGRKKTPSVLYGWTEPHACAGHAVAISANGGCLACGFSDVGKPLLPVTNWPAATLEQEPACGTMYQPYGPVELGYSVNLVSELALDLLLGNEAASVHRMWACRLPVLKANNGSWTEEWLALPDSRNEGGCVGVRVWPANPECPSCGGPL